MTVYLLSTILNEILTIIDFKDDKQVFIDDFILSSSQKALLRLSESLPAEKEPQFREEFDAVDSVDEAQVLLRTFFTQEEIDTSYAEETKRLLAEYISTILPDLSPGQKGKIQEMLSSIESSAILID